MAVFLALVTLVAIIIMIAAVVRLYRLEKISVLGSIAVTAFIFMLSYINFHFVHLESVHLKMVLAVGLLLSVILTVCCFIRYVKRKIERIMKVKTGSRNIDAFGNKMIRFPKMPRSLHRLFFLPVLFGLVVVFGPVKEIYHASSFLREWMLFMVSVIPSIESWGKNSSTPEKTTLLASLAWVALGFYFVLNILYIRFLRASITDRSTGNSYLYPTFSSKLFSLLVSLCLFIFEYSSFLPDASAKSITCYRFACLAEKTLIGQLILFNFGACALSYTVARNIFDFLVPNQIHNAGYVTVVKQYLAQKWAYFLFLCRKYWLIFPAQFFFAMIPYYYAQSTNIPPMDQLQMSEGTFSLESDRSSRMVILKSGRNIAFYTCKSVVFDKHDCYIENQKDLVGKSATIWWFEQTLYLSYTRHRIVRLVVDSEEKVSYEKTLKNIDQSKSFAKTIAIAIFIMLVFVVVLCESEERQNARKLEKSSK